MKTGRLRTARPPSLRKRLAPDVWKSPSVCLPRKVGDARLLFHSDADAVEGVVRGGNVCDDHGAVNTGVGQNIHP